MMIRTIPALLVLLLSTGGAFAQKLKPGLWEITSNVQGGGKEMSAAMANMEKQMASMPPEQRKMMQDMLAKQGMQIGAAAGGGMILKICMTQEMVDRDEMAPQKGDCTHTTSPRVGGTMKYSFQCAKPPASGQGEVTFSSPEAYSMKMTTTTSAGGAERKLDMQSKGRWLDSNCGTIKPIAIPTK